MLKIFRIFMLTLFLGSLFIQQGYCADRYYWLSSNDTATLSLDTQTFRINKDNNWIYFNVWIKWKFTETGVQQIIDTRKKNGLSTAGYEKLSTSLKHEIYSLSKSRKMYKNIQYIDYDINGNILDNFTFLSSDGYRDVPPDTVVESNIYGVLNYYTNARE